MDVPVVPFGKPRPERADAARNREHLLRTVRAMIAELGPESVTMDGLAERAGLGKGTVFRRFGTRAGIFQAVLHDDELRFQERVLHGPPPLGPGAEPKERLIAYGLARFDMLRGNHAIFRAALGHSPLAPASVSMTPPHVRMLLRQASPPLPHPDGLALQLAAALEGPLLLYLRTDELTGPQGEVGCNHLAESWRTLVERVFDG
ncbi:MULTISPECIES: TetR/AcrR family transcriptional regulator [unclassified Nocardiopsis]|uniref:TetR/AcrR family transcriptional regulator n=1 Tax=unclassified Nocardiopsis TaxID=2649073 RepID=UPI002101C8C0|nr:MULTISPECIES: TetR/AcrR family transcriptional regulator [unclassified Nocardiopsis]